MTCKDCIHYDVCMDYTTLKNSNFAQDFNGSDIICDHFKDKSRIVELPCKIGDKVWFLNKYPAIDMKQNAVYEAKVVRVYIEKGTVLTLAVQVKTEWGTTEFPHITDIGKTVFLTREQAEEALRKEREK